MIDRYSDKAELYAREIYRCTVPISKLALLVTATVLPALHMFILLE